MLKMRDQSINDFLIFEIIKQRRLRDLTQENMADELKMSQSRYNKIERGQLQIVIDEWILILQYFDIKLSSVLIENGY
jgi:transcriptional regulator with XRE-family HTH domain